MKNQTFSVLAAKVDEALQSYRDRVSERELAERELRDARTNEDHAREELAQAKREMFEAHPELAPDAAQVRVEDAAWSPPGPGAFTPVEVDDPDDVPDFRERA